MHQLAREFYEANHMGELAFIVPVFSVKTGNASRRVEEDYEPAEGEEVWRFYTRSGEVRFHLHKKG